MAGCLRGTLIHRGGSISWALCSGDQQRKKRECFLYLGKRAKIQGLGVDRQPDQSLGYMINIYIMSLVIRC